MSDVIQAEMKTSAGRELMFKGVNAAGAINGRLLSMLIVQSFKNASMKNTEITYTFPIPFGAVLLGVEVNINGRKLMGIVTSKEEAMDTYEQAISDGDSAVLIERNEDFTFTLALGNLLPDETCAISIRYAQVLTISHGQMRMILPTAIAPRYGNPLTQTTLSPHQITEEDITAEYPFEVTVKIFGELADSNIASPSHATRYAREAGYTEISLARDAVMDRDFVLILSELQNTSVGIAAVDAAEQGQFAVMANFNPQVEGVGAQPIAVKVLLDCSGSMAGESIEAAKRALTELVQVLNFEDRYSLSKFGSTYEHRSRGMWRASKQAQASALRWLEEVESDMGGTEMEKALASTLALAQGEKIDVLLVTDGEIYGIDAVIEVAKMAGQRIFVIAIGSSPAESNLERIANATDGVCDFIAPGEGVHPAILRMYARLRLPRISRLALDVPESWRGIAMGELPTFVYSDDSVTTFLKVPTGSRTLAGSEIKLMGQVGDDATVRTLCTLRVEDAKLEANILARLAAHSEFLELLDGARRDIEAAKSLAIKYQLVTDLTNFILVHQRSESEKALDMPMGYKVPHMVVAGASGLGLSSMSKNATPIASPSLPRAASMRATSPRKSAPPIYLSTFHRKTSFEDMAAKDAEYAHIDQSDSRFWFSGRADQLAKTKSGAIDAFEGVIREEIVLNSCAGLTPAGVVEWLTLNRGEYWHVSLDMLQEMGVAVQICEWLEFSVAEDKPVRLAIRAFMAVMTNLDFLKSCGFRLHRESIDSLRSWGERWADDFQGDAFENLVAKIRVSLSSMKSDKWPNSLLCLYEA